MSRGAAVLLSSPRGVITATLSASQLASLLVSLLVAISLTQLQTSFSLPCMGLNLKPLNRHASPFLPLFHSHSASSAWHLSHCRTISFLSPLLTRYFLLLPLLLLAAATLFPPSLPHSFFSLPHHAFISQRFFEQAGGQRGSFPPHLHTRTHTHKPHTTRHHHTQGSKFLGMAEHGHEHTHAHTHCCPGVV